MVLLAHVMAATAGTLEHDAALEAWRRARVSVLHELDERSAAEVYGPLVLYSWVTLLSTPPAVDRLVVEDGAGRRYTVSGLARSMKDEEILARYRANVGAARAGGLGLLVASVAMVGLGAWGIDDSINGSGSPAAVAAGATFLVLAPIPLWYGFDYGFGPKRRANRFERYWDEDTLERVVERRNEESCAKLGLASDACYVLPEAEPEDALPESELSEDDEELEAE